jgi:rhodanese-related sulfurtransferase
MAQEKTNPLRAGLLIMLVILLTGITLTALLPGHYRIPLQDAAEEAASMDGISPLMFSEAALDGHTGHLLIDIRSPEEYSAGHLAEAVNIPTEGLWTRKKTRKLRKSPVWVYCNQESNAHRTALLLRMRGVEAYPVNTGYQHLHHITTSALNTPPALYFHEEKIRYNYREFFRIYRPEPVEPITIRVAVPTPEGC